MTLMNRFHGGEARPLPTGAPSIARHERAAVTPAEQCSALRGGCMASGKIIGACQSAATQGGLSRAAHARLLSCSLEPLFLADWERTLMIHFEVPSVRLQHAVPFPLDLRNGRAFVSLVAFTMRGLRLRFGGWIGRALFRPIATHGFLNVRAYVRHAGEPGIYFLGEYLSNPLSVPLGPALLGLPYSFARMNYEHERGNHSLRGEVSACSGRFAYEVKLAETSHYAPCPAGSLDEFLMERYTAFTQWRGRRRFFRVWHEPWPQVPAQVLITENSLLTANGPWSQDAQLIGANYSPGVHAVQMGWPHWVKPRDRHSASTTFLQMP